MSARIKVRDLAEVLDPIQDEMALVEARMRDTFTGEEDPLRGIIGELLDSGGKRIRPALVILTSRFHETDRDSVISIAASVELFHTATLVHDDAIDGSHLRRGRPTVNHAWDDQVAVLVGDNLFSRAASLSADVANPELVRLLAETVLTISSGELYEALRDGHEIPTSEEYHARIERKTAALFAAACEGGAILSDAPEAEVSALEQYGRDLGIAFQIVDDVLDFAGREDILGKPIGSDLRQGTVTLPAIYYLREHPLSAELGEVLLRGDGSRLDGLVNAIRSSPSTDDCMAEARSHTEAAKRALEPLPPGSNRQVLSDLADALLIRKR
ncbi:MAG: polyprenyl synthetase family protein [Anaerolineae bacterium]